MYAVIKTGGKQYKVSEGDVIFVEKLIADVDATIEMTEVLAIAGDDGLTVGSPNVDGAKVICKVLAQDKAKKIIVFKFKAKKDYRRKQGHRQPYTKLQVEQILA